jgi:hypothetical protein
VKTLTSARSLKVAQAGCLSLLLGACASNPDDIDAAYVSPIKYQNYDCDQLGVEMDYVGQRTTKLYQRLKDEREADNWQMGVGLVLFWPALFWLEGGDGPDAAEYAQLKGEYEALRDMSVSKKCGIQAKSPQQIIEEEQEKEKQEAIEKADENDAKYRERVVDIAAEKRCVGGISLVSVDGESELWKLVCDETKALTVECSESSCTTTEEYK